MTTPPGPPPTPPPGYPQVGQLAGSSNRTLRLILSALVVVLLLLCGIGGGTAAILITRQLDNQARGGPQRSPSPSNPLRASRAPTSPSPVPPWQTLLVYEVSGQGHAMVNYIDPADPAAKILDDAPLPWRIELPRQPMAFVRVTAFRSSRTSGELTCRILLDGKEIARSSDLAAYHSASCQELVPPG
jgi:hypothetical protein